MKRVHCKRCGCDREVPDDYRWKQCPECREYMREYVNRYRREHPKYYKREVKRMRERFNKLKLKVFRHYGGNPPKCACCGETTFEFLELDHIHGGANEHRRKIGGRIYKGKLGITTQTVYEWLIENNFPEGIVQVLCANCNKAKGRHKKRFCPIHHPELYQ